MLRVATSGLVGTEHLLTGDAAHYLHRVRRSAAGDELCLFDPDAGTEARAVLLSVSNGAVSCRLLELTPGSRRGIEGLRLLQGLGKGDKAEQVVKHAVALGVQSIEFVACDRSVARPTSRDADKEQRLRRVAVDVARQCGRSNVPTIGMNVPWADSLSKARADGTLVALHTDTSALPLESALANAGSVITVAVGPEGGFSSNELRDLAECGAQFASLGELVLRTELAAVAALARTGVWLLSHRT